MVEKTETFIAFGLSKGTEAKLRRISLHLRQIDLACLAKVSTQDVVNLEKDRPVKNREANRMFYWLDMPLITHQYWALPEVEDYLRETFGNSRDEWLQSH